MKKTITLSLLTIGIFVLGGCSLSGKTTTPNTQAPTATQTPTSDTISIQNFAFSPGTLTVKKDTTVTWINNDSALHQIKSATFNSAQLSKGQNFSFTFNATGTFDYSCSIHPSMTGKIIVE